jgi:hypothetical protein
MKYIVKTYQPINLIQFNTIQEAKKYMIEFSFLNDISLGNLDIDKNTISLQISDKNNPKIRFERNPILFN